MKRRLAGTAALAVLHALLLGTLARAADPGHASEAARQSKEVQEAARLQKEVSSLYQEGKYSEALPLAKRAAEILEKGLGPEHPDVATSLNDLASLLRAMGSYAEARPLHERSLAIREKQLGPEHLDVATSLNNRGGLYEAVGDVGRAAVGFLNPGNDIREHNLALILATGSEDQKRAYVATLIGETYATVSLHARAAPDNPQALTLALSTVLRRKGRVLDAMTDALLTEKFKHRGSP